MTYSAANTFSRLCNDRRYGYLIHLPDCDSFLLFFIDCGCGYDADGTVPRTRANVILLSLQLFSLSFRYPMDLS